MHVLLAYTGAQSWALLLVAASVGGLLWWSQRSARRVSGSPRREALPSPASGDGLKPEELRRWEVEMYELARSLTGELNTRIAVLQQLLRSAEREAARLEMLLARPPASALPGAERSAPAGEIAAGSGAPPGEIERFPCMLPSGAER